MLNIQELIFFSYFQEPAGGWCDFDQSMEVWKGGSRCRNPLEAFTRPAVASLFLISLSPIFAHFEACLGLGAGFRGSPSSFVV
jgi:hypothetical protein